jgi:hypothetical protein
MNAVKIKAKEITIKDLVKEAIENIPNGWHEEVWLENEEVTFSAPMTQTSYSNKGAMYGTDPDYIGDLHSLSWEEIEGFYLRKDGKIELDDSYDGEDILGSSYQKGEYYEYVTIYTAEEALQVLADYLDNNASDVAQLITAIKEKQL